MHRVFLFGKDGSKKLNIVLIFHIKMERKIEKFK